MKDTVIKDRVEIVSVGFQEPWVARPAKWNKDGTIRKDENGNTVYKGRKLNDGSIDFYVVGEYRSLTPEQALKLAKGIKKAVKAYRKAERALLKDTE